MKILFSEVGDNSISIERGDNNLSTVYLNDIELYVTDIPQESDLVAEISSLVLQILEDKVIYEYRDYYRHEE